MVEITQSFFHLSEDTLKEITEHVNEAYTLPSESSDLAEFSEDELEDEIVEDSGWVDVIFRFMDGKRIIIVQGSNDYKSGPIFPDE